MLCHAGVLGPFQDHAGREGLARLSELITITPLGLRKRASGIARDFVGNWSGCQRRVLGVSWVMCV
jgi:hypothetical protein